MKAKVTVTRSAVATMKSLFGICDCMVYNDVGMGDFSLVHGTLHMYGYVHV